MTNDSVLAMVTENLPLNLILSQIQSAPEVRFDLSTQEVIRLTKGGVTSDVIEQMRDPRPVSPRNPQHLRRRPPLQRLSLQRPPLLRPSMLLFQTHYPFASR